MDKKKRIIIIMTVIIAVLAVVSAGLVLLLNKDKGPKVPEVFDVNGVTLPAIAVEQKEPFNVSEIVRAIDPQYVEEQPDELDVSVPSREEESDDESGSAPVPNYSTMRSYTYSNLNDPQAVVEAYVENLKSEELGFCAIDQDLIKVQEIKWDELEGPLMLARQEESGDLLRVNIIWDSSACTVDLFHAKGTLKDKPEPVTITYLEAVDYVKSFPPSVLNLTGASMDDYRVYTVDGYVIINGQHCIRMNVYCYNEPLGTNELAGQYYLSSDAAHFYELVAERTVKEIDLRSYADHHHLF